MQESKKSSQPSEERDTLEFNEIEEVIDTMYPLSFLSRNELKLADKYKVAKGNLTLGNWKHTMPICNVYIIDIDTLIYIYISLIKEVSLPYRDQWRSIIVSEIYKRLNIYPYEILSSSINKKKEVKTIINNI